MCHFVKGFADMRFPRLIRFLIPDFAFERCLILVNILRILYLGHHPGGDLPPHPIHTLFSSFQLMTILRS
jgi:hypothetical protein